MAAVDRLVVASKRIDGNVPLTTGFFLPEAVFFLAPTLTLF